MREEEENYRAEESMKGLRGDPKWTRARNVGAFALNETIIGISIWMLSHILFFFFFFFFSLLVAVVAFSAFIIRLLN